MATTESFVVRFSARGADSIARATKAIKRQFAELGQSVARVSKLIAGIGLATGAAFTAGIVRAARSLAELNKEAARTGLAVENVQALRDAGELMGVQLDEMTGALEEFHLRLAEVGKLSPDLLRAGGFEPQGNRSARDVALSMGPAQQMATMMSALAQLRDAPAMQKFIADELMGGDAFKLLALINRGGLETVNQIGQRNRDLGIDLQGGSGAGEALTRSLTEIQQIFRGLFETIASSDAVVGVVQEFQAALEQMIRDMGGGREIARDFAQAVRDVADALRWAYNALSLPGKLGAAAGRGLASAFSQSTSEIDRLYRESKGAKLQVEDRELNATLSGLLRFGVPAAVAQ